jgi:LacI family gluconate utilization system Gnt-I transcriptional repressor
MQTTEDTSALPTRRRSAGRATLADVAREAGVSPITASRALRGERSVAPSLVDRVIEAVARIGYVPDSAARALASQRGTHVPVLIPMLSNTLFVDLLEAVHHTLFSAGFQPMIGVTHYDPRQEELLLRSYLAQRPAGLLLTGFDRTEHTRQMIARSGVPCVHLMELTDAPGIHCVGFSQFDAGAAVTRHLLSRGRHRIACITAQLDPRTIQRADGYRAALREAGCYDPALEFMSRQPSSIALGADLFADLVKIRPDIDAVFFCNDDLAQGGIFSAQRLGIRVPADIAMAGFNDLSGSDQLIPSLTTVRTPRSEIGAKGAEMLVELMRGRVPPTDSVSLDYELIVRESS